MAEVSSLLTALKAAVSNPVDDLCVADAEKSKHFLSLLRGLYNSFQESSEKPFGPFQELIVDGLDVESIWEELQMWNKPLTRFVKKRIKYLHKSMKENKEIDQEERDKEGEDQKYGDQVEDGTTGASDEDDAYVDDSVADDESEDGEMLEDKLRQNLDSDNDNDDENSEQLDEDMKIEMDLDRFEEMEERAIRRKEKSDKDGHEGATDMNFEEDEDYESDVDDFAFAEENMYTSDNEEDEGGDLMADDFFGDAPSSSRGNAAGSKKKSKAVAQADDQGDDNSSFDYGDDDEDDRDDDDEDDGDDDDDDDDEEGGQEVEAPERSSSRSLWDDDDSDVEDKKKTINSSEELSNFEKREIEKMKEIKKLEEELMAKKPWEMMGEAKASDRPFESLLNAEFDVALNFKRPPLITPQVTSTIEEMIISRIKDEKYDDVQRKVVEPVKYVDKTLPEVSQEKSSLGLGQIYEDEFMERTTGTSVTKGKRDAKEDAICKEVDYLFQKVTKQLDALSHFHYTPKPTIAEPTFKSLEVSSISMEEVAPAFLNDAATAAPEELKEKRTGRNGAFITEADIGRDDRKRLRRATKAANKKAKLADNGGYKQRADEISNIIQKDRRVISGKNVKSSSNASKGSTSFFQNMQHQVEMEIKNKSGALKAGKAAD